MEDFEEIKRWYHAKEVVGEWGNGNWVTWQDYKKLLDAYKELKYRIESLEK